MPKKNEYHVRIQVIKIYDIFVQATSKANAVSLAEEMQSTTIEADGKLFDVVTENAEVVE